jgi:cation diffusion facilitator family transporter
MADCCSAKNTELERLATTATLRRVLVAVLAINAVMFAGELAVGLWAGSAALIADSADMFGDAFVYAISLYALERSSRWKAGAAMLKGGIILLLGVMVIVEIVSRAASGEPPASGLMLAASAVALAANLVCFRLLWRFRRHDVNMASTFECSRNDLIANGGVIVAAIGVWLTASPWPDIAVAAIIAAVFLGSAVRVLRAAVGELRAPAANEALAPSAHRH